MFFCPESKLFTSRIPSYPSLSRFVEHCALLKFSCRTKVIKLLKNFQVPYLRHLLAAAEKMLLNIHRLRKKNFREIGRFFHEFVPKNPAKFDFFFHDLSEALIIGISLSVMPLLDQHCS